ncbi:hypothetical protein J6590_055606 [Homalodisca vitripennis]|nr:hypothetical protein J6590_055606 [Homalodisca vitripennis]
MDEEDAVRVDGRLVPLHQLLDFIEGNDDAITNTRVNITLLPPTNATDDMTDEDSGDEDNVEIDNVPPSQINAPAFLEVVNDELKQKNVTVKKQCAFQKLLLQIKGLTKERTHALCFKLIVLR